MSKTFFNNVFVCKFRYNYSSNELSTNIIMEINAYETINKANKVRISQHLPEKTRQTLISQQ